MKYFGVFLYFLPKRCLSRCVGHLVQIQRPVFLVKIMKAWFVDYYNLNMDEAEKPIEEYSSLSKLFTRALKPGLRPVSEASVVHPADARVSSHGWVKEGQLWQIKGWRYSLADLLATSRDLSVLEDAYFATYYLCPTDYHRVHSPVAGKVVQITYVPGTLWPVNEWSVNKIPGLFTINERLVIWIETSRGLAALVMVGATNVGRITAAFDSQVLTNSSFSDQYFEKSYAEPITIEKGNELATFHMGSTVVLVMENKVLDRPPEIKSGMTTRIGETF